MHQSGSRTLIVLAGGFILLALLLFLRPQYLASPQVLGAAIAAQVLLLALTRYKEAFFAILMGAFLWAGMDLPASASWLQGRWIVLVIGTVTGLAIYVRDPNHRFGLIHLLAFSCVLSAVVSASVSAYPQEALLKSLSLFLLFLYGVTGARLAVPLFEPEKFFRKLLVACELITYTTAIGYFALRWPMFGNPNSLGAIMGVVVVPVMLWGFLCAESIMIKRRLGIELALAIALLMSTYARAGIAGAAVACFLVCIAMRRYRLIVGGIAVSIAIAVLTALLVPQPEGMIEGGRPASISSLFLYKGKPGEDLMASRRGPWNQTMAVIKEHPWFGSGFGTSVTQGSATYFELTRTRFVDSRMIREHGNSYLAILEWSGLLGVVPFYLLIVITASKAKTALVQLRRTGNIFAPAVPAAAILVAGLIDAGFEDWLFAVGYYLSVFLWAMAFILADLLHSSVVVGRDETSILISERQFVPSAAVQFPRSAFQ
jgi:O-antigen ligase